MEENNKGSKKIYMAIIIVLLLINGVAGYLLFNENKEKQTKIDEIAKLDTDFKSMNAEFETAKTDLESLKGKNAELDAIIMERQATIEKYQGELAAAQRKGNLSAAEIKRYKDLIAELQASNDNLQKKVAELTDKNQALTAQNLELDQNLNTEKQTTAALSVDKENLAKKVALGSILQLQISK
jgi:chromosome segregation ATPase